MIENIKWFFRINGEEIVEYTLVTLGVIGIAAALVGWVVFTYIAWS